MLLNAGNATFPRVLSFAAEGEATRILAADLDQDGLPDLATANGSTNNVSVLFNQPGLFAGKSGK